MAQKKAQVVILPARTETSDKPGKKVVEASQDAINRLPADSGEWKIRGVLGLLVWKGKHSTSYRLVRRVHGRLIKRTLDAESLAEAKREAIRAWKSLTPRPPEAQPIPTLEEALKAYLESKRLAERTKADYDAVVRRYLADWLGRRLDAIAADRAGFRKRLLDIERKHGAAAAALLIRVYRALHRWHKKVMPDIGDSPTEACETPQVRARDWALSDDELRAWWDAVQKLNPLKQTFWLTLLLTGARRDSVRLLKWKDCDFEKKLIRFSAAKGGRTYAVPMSERLARILDRWRDDCIPGEWVFPSPQKPGQPLHPIVRDDKKGVCSPHHLRHSFRTRLAECGATPDLARIALGHALTQDVSQRYITPALLVEAVRPLFNAVAEKYAAILGWD